MASATKVALVVGAGSSTGSAIARRFAREGFTVCMTRRNADQLQPDMEKIKRMYPKSHVVGVGMDAREEDQVAGVVDMIENDLGPLEAAIFNVGANVKFDVRDTTTRVFRKVWELACLGGFHTGREAARVMVPRERGTIIFTGASASIRGRPGFAAFASAKHGLRAVSQSLARELSPKGIHVAHTVIDGAIDTPWIHENFSGAAEMKKVDGLLNPDHIAEGYWYLHNQERSCWTHELDMRPWVEQW